MKTLTPENVAQRSFIQHQQPAAEYIEINEALLMAEIEVGESTLAQPPCTLVDLSTLCRTGLRGPATAKLLHQVGLSFPQGSNQCTTADSGQTVLRLGKTESWVLGSLEQSNAVIQQLDDSTSDAECYPLYCRDSHAWFLMTGKQLPAIMAKLCAVDLREDAFPLNTVAQTSVARVNAIVARHSFAGQEVFTILSDSASAGYLWQALLDAMTEFDGKAVGVNSLL